MADETNLVYFQKELVSNPINLSRGGTVRWDPIGDDEGIIATKTDWLVVELRAFASKRIGGVTEITKDDYDAKKNSAVPELRPRRGLADPPQFPLARADIRDAPLVAAAEVFKSPRPEKQTAPDYVQAMVPGDVAHADPGSNRPVARKIAKFPKADSQPSILP